MVAVFLAHLCDVYALMGFLHLLQWIYSTLSVVCLFGVFGVCKELRMCMQLL